MSLEHLKFEVGDTVLIKCNIGGSNNQVGDIGVITEIDQLTESGWGVGYRVVVNHRENWGNWHLTDQLEIFTPTSDIIEKYKIIAQNYYKQTPQPVLEYISNLELKLK